jgi:hypothetical protein
MCRRAASPGPLPRGRPLRAALLRRLLPAGAARRGGPLRWRGAPGAAGPRLGLGGAGGPGEPGGGDVHAGRGGRRRGGPGAPRRRAAARGALPRAAGAAPGGARGPRRACGCWSRGIGRQRVFSPRRTVGPWLPSSGMGTCGAWRSSRSAARPRLAGSGRWAAARPQHLVGTRLLRSGMKTCVDLRRSASAECFSQTPHRAAQARTQGPGSCTAVPPPRYHKLFCSRRPRSSVMTHAGGASVTP